MSATTHVHIGLYFIAVVGFAAYIVHRLLWLQSLQENYLACWLDFFTVIVAAACMLAMPFWNRRSPLSAWPAILAGGLLGLIFFVSTLGFALVAPTNIDWLLHGDWAQHFVGWHMYRNAPWQWPPGAFDTFWYPVGTAVVYTDSLPLLAMPLKLISPLLPQHFQYIGIWVMLNCVLQGMFGVLLLRCFTRNFLLQVLGAGMLVLAPVFISRIDHDTLTTQWLLLAGFWLYFRHGDPQRAVWYWVGFAAVAALVHPYLSAMVLALMIGFYVRVMYAQRQLNWQTGSRSVATVIAVTLFCWWLSGAFIIRPNAGNVEFGVASANLLTWFSSAYMSRWLPVLPQVSGAQYEGRGFLGIGVLALSAIAIVVSCLRTRRYLSTSFPLWPLLAVVAAMTLFAFSTRVTFGSHVLFDVTPPRLPLLDTFRASGRFIWPSVYLITLFTVVLVAQRTGRAAPWLLAVAFLLQLYDLAPLHVREAQMRIGHSIDPRPAALVLHDPYWVAATAGRQHITLVPPPACGKAAAPYFPFSLLAGDRGLTINTGYLARWDERATQAYCRTLAQQLQKGERDVDDLYIVSREDLPKFRATSLVRLDCRRVEGYMACVVARPTDQPDQPSQ